ncbi:MAG: hypothetical protein ACI4C1_05655 [Lachnospiraceae bacterium]
MKEKLKMWLKKIPFFMGIESEEEAQEDTVNTKDSERPSEEVEMEEAGLDNASENNIGHVITWIVQMVIFLMVGFGLGIIWTREIANNFGDQKRSAELSKELEEQAALLNQQQELINQQNEQINAQSSQINEQSEQINQQSSQLEEMESFVSNLQLELSSAQEEASKMSEQISYFQQYANQIYIQAKNNLGQNLKQYGADRDEEAKGEILLCEEELIYASLLEVMQEEFQGGDYTSEETNFEIQNYCAIFQELCPDSKYQAGLDRVSEISNAAVECAELRDQLADKYSDIESAAGISSKSETKLFYVQKKYTYNTNVIIRFFYSFYDSLRYGDKELYLANNVEYEAGEAVVGSDYYILLSDEALDTQKIYQFAVNDKDDRIEISLSSKKNDIAQAHVCEIISQSSSVLQDYKDWLRYEKMIDCYGEMLDKSLSNDSDYLEQMAGMADYVWMMGTWSGITEDGFLYTVEVTDVEERQITMDFTVASEDWTQREQKKGVVSIYSNEGWSFEYIQSEAEDTGNGSLQVMEGSSQGSLNVAVSNREQSGRISLAVSNFQLTNFQYGRQLKSI